MEQIIFKWQISPTVCSILIEMQWQNLLISWQPYSRLLLMTEYLYINCIGTVTQVLFFFSFSPRYKSETWRESEAEVVRIRSATMAEPCTHREITGPVNQATLSALLQSTLPPIPPTSSAGSLVWQRYPQKQQDRVSRSVKLQSSLLNTLLHCDWEAISQVRSTWEICLIILNITVET